MDMKKIILFIAVFFISTVWSATPVINLINLYNDNDGQQTYPTTTLTGNDYMTVWFQIRDDDGFTNIDTIDVIFWDSNYSSVTDANSDAYHAQYKYYRKYADWSLIGPFSWDIKEICSSGPSSTVSNTFNQNFILVFRPSSQAKEESAQDWRIAVVVKDNDGNATNKSFSCNLVQIANNETAGSGGVFFAAPNPVKMSESDATIHFYYEPGFSDACSVTLEIYTIYGELVKTLLKDQSFSVNQTLSETWDGKNGSNLLVASGIYSAVLTIKYSSGQDEKQYFQFALYK